MGKFSMLILFDRAQRRGVKKVDYLFCKGNFFEQLHLLAIETGAEVMVLGRPVRGMGRRVFTPAKFDSFVESLEQETGIHIVQITSNKSEESPS
jgi:hypothetical protein